MSQRLDQHCRGVYCPPLFWSKRVMATASIWTTIDHQVITVSWRKSLLITNLQPSNERHNQIKLETNWQLPKNLSTTAVADCKTSVILAEDPLPIELSVWGVNNKNEKFVDIQLYVRRRWCCAAVNNTFLVLMCPDRSTRRHIFRSCLGKWESHWELDRLLQFFIYLFIYLVTYWSILKCWREDLGEAVWCTVLFVYLLIATTS